MKITLEKKSRTPLYWQIADQIKRQILQGILTDGTILPSERLLADEIQVHRNTIIKAYGLLKDQELIESMQGVGYKVTYAEEGESPGVHMGQGVNWSQVIKDEYQDMEKTFDDFFQRSAEENCISFSAGMPPSVFNADMVAESFAAILMDEQKQPLYLSPYQGDLLLRKSIATFLRRKNIRANLAQIQVLSETNQAWDFIVTALLKPGDCVLVEEPVSPDVYRTVILAGCKVITVPIDDNGICCDHLEPLLKQHRPKLIFVNSSFHDPTGVVMSPERRKKLLDLANRYRIPIVEEDAASELPFDKECCPTSLKAMDVHENVIYIYSFSLTFIPGLSLAFVVAPEKLVKSLSYLVSIRMISLDWISQKLLAKFMRDGVYTKNVDIIGELNLRNAEVMSSYLDRLKPLGLRYKMPRGGVYIWCELPPAVDSRDVASLCMKEGVAVIPGTVFYPNGRGGHSYLRLNYSFESEERVCKGMEIFNRVVERLSENA